MIAFTTHGPTRHRRGRAELYIIVLLLVVGLVAFAIVADLPPFRGNAYISEPSPRPSPVEPPAALPQRTFEAGLRSLHPEVFAFVNEFLEMCLAGDYAGYRLRVSRLTTPETRERFTLLYHSMQLVHVESIELLDAARVPALPAPVYRVISRVEFKPDSRVTLRERNRKPAILVFKEEGEWRMMPAPPSLQPRDPDSQPATDEVAEPTYYPWDVEPDK
jgi:hypothetical protein